MPVSRRRWRCRDKALTPTSSEIAKSSPGENHLFRAQQVGKVPSQVARGHQNRSSLASRCLTVLFCWPRPSGRRNTLSRAYSAHGFRRRSGMSSGRGVRLRGRVCSRYKRQQDKRLLQICRGHTVWRRLWAEKARRGSFRQRFMSGARRCSHLSTSVCVPQATGLPVSWRSRMAIWFQKKHSGLAFSLGP